MTRSWQMPDSERWLHSEALEWAQSYPARDEGAGSLLKDWREDQDAPSLTHPRSE